MRMHRALVAILVAASAAGCVMGGTFTSCSPPRPRELTTDDLIGRYSGPHAGTVTLSTGGTFEADQLESPDYSLPTPLPSTPFTAVFQTGGPRSTYTSGHGTWALVDRTPSQTDLSLTFEQADGTKAGYDLIDVSGTRTEPYLYYFYGDPDSCDIRKLIKDD